MRKKLLILSDAPTTNTGLGRITRELALRIDTMPEFEVATLGQGQTTSKRLGFQQYLTAGMNHLDMIPPNLPEVWKDFAGDEHGILFTIMNPGWLRWLARPQDLPICPLRTFLESKPFDVWAYLPIDAEGPLGKLPMEIASIIGKFDRILAYTKWEADMIERTIGGNCPYLPHGTDTTIFYPRNRTEARHEFLSIVSGRKMPPLHKDVFVVGAIGTNTPRKDWPLAFKVCRELQDRGVKVALWAHTDVLRKHWDIQGLQVEYGLEGAVINTTISLTDDQMALAMCACDVMLGVGQGEGWGLPLSEALACGVPVIHGNYAGGTQFIPSDMLIDPVAFYNDGFYCHQRPVFNAGEWAERVIRVTNVLGDYRYISLLSPDYEWDNCWDGWKQWLLEGLK